MRAEHIDQSAGTQCCLIPTYIDLQNLTYLRTHAKGTVTATDGNVCWCHAGRGNQNGNLNENQLADRNGKSYQKAISGRL